VAMNGYSLKLVTIAACCLSVTAGARAFGQVLQGEAALGSWHDDNPAGLVSGHRSIPLIQSRR
jgi:hypothetical protein